MKIQKILSLAMMLLVVHSVTAQTAAKYSYSVDLTKVKDDKLEVTLLTPDLGKKQSHVSNAAYCTRHL